MKEWGMLSILGLDEQLKDEHLLLLPQFKTAIVER
jgi:hypothetical protein